MTFNALLLNDIAIFAQVVIIDLVMAGDNAVAVGLAASGVDPKLRPKAIIYGLVLAVILRICFVLITVQLLKITGLLIAGGCLLLWVAWKLWFELRNYKAMPDLTNAELALGDAVGLKIGKDSVSSAPPKTKKLSSAVFQILIADVAMSLDNTLAVSGAASEHIAVLAFGLLFSIAIMGFAAHLIASVLHIYRWIGYFAVCIIVYVAFHMIFKGCNEILALSHCQLDKDSVSCLALWLRHLPH